MFQGISDEDKGSPGIDFSPRIISGEVAEDDRTRIYIDSSLSAKKRRDVHTSLDMVDRSLYPGASLQPRTPA